MSIKKYSSGSWVDVPYRKYETATDTITTLPKQIIADGQSASAVIKGNLSQSGTPTPASPIYPTECGDLVASGEHSGQYQIPILSGGVTTPVYLGEVQSTRQIRKIVLTGQENWGYSVLNDKARAYNDPITVAMPSSIAISSHYPYQDTATGYPDVGKFTFNATKSIIIGLNPNEYTSASDFKTYLQQQYANGTPVTIWYVLATPTTTTLNEPIRKIGNYADSVSVTGIPTTGTAESFDIDTDLKPSEVSLTYHGWHEHQPEKYVGG